MARHRAAHARAAAPDPAAPTGTAVLTGGHRAADLAAALPRQGLTEAHPSGPLPRAGRSTSRHTGGLDADTAALDLAAIALAAASARPAGPPTGSAALPQGSGPASGPLAAPTTGGTPRPSYPAAVPSALAPITPSHAVPAVGRGGRGSGRRVPLPTRTAGALALVGALAGGGVAVVGGNAVLTADPTPTTGELRTGDVATAAADAAGSAAAVAQVPTGGQDDGQDDGQDQDAQDQGGRHRADDGASSYAGGGY
ncbi:hypothetical protein PHK61_29480 [Actinomycetospora lutea]|uniref:hypothetical protein n=1 Tax=Actinomycetospora lutea TaxID=663604 RepID=UPI002367257F|nr:hypothetical protein [Actinomycetospora lutea]MDD7942551.1 hypothetical protein [Actinomycetospora lutea]